MPIYVVLINMTEQGVKTIKDLPGRVKAAREAMERAGGKFVDWYLTMGMYDAVAIVEIPDDDLAAAILLGAGKHGNIKTITLKAFSETEASSIIQRIS